MKRKVDHVDREVARDLTYFVEWTNNLAMLIFLAMGMMLLALLLSLLILQSVNPVLFGQWQVAAYGLFMAFAIFAVISMVSIDHKRRQLEKEFMFEAKK